MSLTSLMYSREILWSVHTRHGLAGVVMMVLVWYKTGDSITVIRERSGWGLGTGKVIKWHQHLVISLSPPLHPAFPFTSCCRFPVSVPPACPVSPPSPWLARPPHGCSIGRCQESHLTNLFCTKSYQTHVTNYHCWKYSGILSPYPPKWPKRTEFQAMWELFLKLPPLNLFCLIQLTLDSTREIDIWGSSPHLRSSRSSGISPSLAVGLPFSICLLTRLLSGIVFCCPE